MKLFSVFSVAVDTQTNRCGKLPRTRYKHTHTHPCVYTHTQINTCETAEIKVKVNNLNVN